MSTFGNRLPTIMPMGQAQPDLADANLAAQAGQVLQSVFGAVQATQGEVLNAKRRSLENKQMAQKLDLGEQQVEEARSRAELVAQHAEVAKLGLDNEKQRHLYDKLVDAEALGVVTKRGEMSEADWTKYLAAHPIVDPDLANKVAVSQGHSWAEADITGMYRALSEGAVNGQMPSVTSLVDQQLSKRAGDFQISHPAARDAYKTKLLEVANGYIRGEQANRTAEFQRRTTGAVDSEIGSLIGRAYLGEVTPEEMVQRSSEQFVLIPGARREDGQIDRKGYESYLAGKISNYAASHVLPNPTASLDPLNKLISSMSPGVQDQLKGYGLQQEIKDTETARANALQSSTVNHFAKWSTDLAAQGDMVNLKSLRHDAERLTGDAKTTALLDIDAKIKTLQDTRGGKQTIIDSLNGKSVSSEFTPTPAQANLAWDERITSLAPENVAADFVAHGFDLPPNGIKWLKSELDQNPTGALNAIVNIAHVNSDRARDIADAVDHDGLLSIGASAVATDPAMAEMVVPLLSNPMAKQVAVKARDILHQKKDGELVFNASAEIGSRLNLGDKPFIGVPTINMFKDRFSLRYIESALMGLDPEIAQSRASQLAALDVSRGTVAVPTPLDEHGMFWWGGPFTLNVNIDRQTLVPAELYGIGSMKVPNAKSRGQFYDALDTLFDATDSPPRPDLGFPMAGNSFVPALDQNGLPSAYLEWSPGAHESRVVKEGDKDFNTVDTFFMARTTVVDRHPLSSLRKPEGFKSTAVAAYDEENGVAPEAGYLGTMAKYVKRRWADRYGRLPQSTDEMKSFEADVLDVARMLGWDSLESSSPTPVASK